MDTNESKKILITGFGPYWIYKENPSEYFANELYNLLKSQPNISCDEPKIIHFSKCLLAHTRIQDMYNVCKSIKENEYDYIISFGQNPRAKKNTLELSNNPLISLDDTNLFPKNIWKEGTKFFYYEFYASCTHLGYCLRYYSKYNNYKYNFIHIPRKVLNDPQITKEYATLLNNLAKYIINHL